MRDFTSLGKCMPGVRKKNQMSPSLLIVYTKESGSNKDRERERGWAGGDLIHQQYAWLSKMSRLRIPQRLSWHHPSLLPLLLHASFILHMHTFLVRPSFCSNFTLEGWTETWHLLIVNIYLLLFFFWQFLQRFIVKSNHRGKCKIVLLFHINVNEHIRSHIMICSKYVLQESQKRKQSEAQKAAAI